MTVACRDMAASRAIAPSHLYSPYIATTATLTCNVNVVHLQVYVSASGVTAVVAFGLYGSATTLWGMSSKAKSDGSFSKPWELLTFAMNGIVFFFVGASSVNFFIRSSDAVFGDTGVMGEWLLMCHAITKYAAAPETIELHPGQQHNGHKAMHTAHCIAPCCRVFGDLHMQDTTNNSSWLISEPLKCQQVVCGTTAVLPTNCVSIYVQCCIGSASSKCVEDWQLHCNQSIQLFWQLHPVVHQSIRSHAICILAAIAGLVKSLLWRLPVIYVSSFILRWLLMCLTFPVLKLLGAEEPLNGVERVFATVGGLRGALSLILAQTVVADESDTDKLHKRVRGPAYFTV